jgi:hypothetical protein
MRPINLSHLFYVFFAASAPVAGQDAVITYHNDGYRTGLNPQEIQLKPTNVNKSSFGKLFTQPVDGQVYTQPLYVPHLPIAGGIHNVVFVATEHDSVYAFDADSYQVPLWHVTFLDPSAGITTVSKEDAGYCKQIEPEIGVTDTPVIDLSTNTIYMVAMTKQLSGEGDRFFQELHALDLTTGAEKFGGPCTIQASVPGTGDGAAADVLNPRSYKTRSGLALVNGVVYVSFTSHCDFNNWGTYHGWMVGYNASAVTQQMGVFNVTPDGNEGAIWSSGDAPSVDENGNLYVETSNGTFDADKGGRDYSDSILRIGGAGTPSLTVADYFTPANQEDLSDSDQDVGSAGQILLPGSYAGPGHPHLLTGADKTGEIYLLDRDNLGGYRKGNQGSDAAVQEFHAAPLTNGQCFMTPACFNGFVYWSMVADHLKAYRLSRGRYQTKSSSETRETFAYPGCVPSVTSNGNKNGIVWAIQPGKTAILRAYDAANLGRELYNSAQNSERDSTGSPNNKFTPPTIVNGKVYVPTTNSLVVYGLLKDR